MVEFCGTKDCDIKEKECRTNCVSEFLNGNRELFQRLEVRQGSIPIILFPVGPRRIRNHFISKDDMKLYNDEASEFPSNQAKQLEEKDSRNSLKISFKKVADDHVSSSEDPKDLEEYLSSVTETSFVIASPTVSKKQSLYSKDSVESLASNLEESLIALEDSLSKSTDFLPSVEKFKLKNKILRIRLAIDGILSLEESGNTGSSSLLRFFNALKNVPPEMKLSHKNCVLKFSRPAKRSVLLPDGRMLFKLLEYNEKCFPEHIKEVGAKAAFLEDCSLYNERTGSNTMEVISCPNKEIFDQILKECKNMALCETWCRVKALSSPLGKGISEKNCTVYKNN